MQKNTKVSSSARQALLNNGQNIATLPNQLKLTCSHDPVCSVLYLYLDIIPLLSK